MNWDVHIRLWLFFFFSFWVPLLCWTIKMSSRLQAPVFMKDQNYEVTAAATARVYWSCTGKKTRRFHLSSLAWWWWWWNQNYGGSSWCTDVLVNWKREMVVMNWSIFDKHLKKGDPEEELAKHDFDEFSQWSPQILAFFNSQESKLEKDDCLLVISDYKT